MPRAGLTSERVVAAAAAMADESGVDNLTLAALARSLGVRQPSLYKHIGGMEDLLRGVSLRARAQLAEELSRATVGRSRGQAVRSLASAYRTWAVRHPGQYATLVRAPDAADPQDVAASARVVGVVVDVLAGFGLEGPEAIHATRALRAGLHGFVVLESGGGFGLPVSIDESFAYLVEGYVAALEASAAGEP